MKVLAVCESPPTTDATYGNGSTLITARTLPCLPPFIDLQVAYFEDRPAAPDAAVVLRASRVASLPVRGARSALLAQPLTRLPRASWQRAHVTERVRELAREVDVVYLHGLHTFGLASAVGRPCVAHEVDPWSLYWLTRAGTGHAWRRWYDRSQAARAAELERAVGRVAHTYLVVNPDDAAELSLGLGRAVEAIPNGTDGPPRAGGQEQAHPQPNLIGFVGTLDYPPNVEAVRTLCTDIMPRIRRLVPDARLVIAGRRPVKDVLRYAGDDVDIVGEVADTRDVFRQLAVAVCPTSTGRGTKNTVREALAMGCPVVASPAAASGFDAAHEGLQLATDAEELAQLVAEVLTHPDRRASASLAAARSAQSLPTWSDAARQLADALTSAAGNGAAVRADRAGTG